MRRSWSNSRWMSACACTAWSRCSARAPKRSRRNRSRFRKRSAATIRVRAAAARNTRNAAVRLIAADARRYTQIKFLRIGVNLRASAASLRDQFFACADLAQAAVDPLLGQLLLHAVLREPRAQVAKVHVIERLVLIEAGKHHRLFARHRIFVQSASTARKSPSSCTAWAS